MSRNTTGIQDAREAQPILEHAAQYCRNVSIGDDWIEAEDILRDCLDGINETIWMAEGGYRREMNEIEYDRSGGHYS